MMGIKSQRLIIFSLLMFVSVLKLTEACPPRQTVFERLDEPEIDEPITDAVIKSSSALKLILRRDKTHGRQHNLQLFNALSCKGIFNNDAMTILTSMCDYCYKVNPSMATVQYYCTRNCFTSHRFDLCKEFHANISDLYHDLIHETDLIVQELSGLKVEEF